MQHNLDKGIGAALLMANLQANVRSQIVSAIDYPESYLNSVNGLRFRNTALSSYATLFFVVYDSATCRIRYTNCGHLPGLILRADGSTERLDSTNTVIGFFEEWSCTSRESCFGPGDTLALYSDGVTESPNSAGEEFEEKRLVESLRSYSALDADVQAPAVVRDVAHFGAGDQFDNITLMVVKQSTLK